MIRVIETEMIKMEMLDNGQVKLKINGVVEDVTMNADQLKELMSTADYFYGVNNLYQHTEEAIRERKRWEEEDLKGPITGLVSGAIGRY